MISDEVQGEHLQAQEVATTNLIAQDLPSVKKRSSFCADVISI
jgi:hypothetical protein